MIVRMVDVSEGSEVKVKLHKHRNINLVLQRPFKSGSFNIFCSYQLLNIHLYCANINVHAMAHACRFQLGRLETLNPSNPNDMILTNRI